MTDNNLYDNLEFEDNSINYFKNISLEDTKLSDTFTNVLIPDGTLELSHYGLRIPVHVKVIPTGTRWIKDYPKEGFKKGDLYKADKPLVSFDYITIHNTGVLNSDNDAELYARATFNQNMGSARVHYYVDHKSIWKILFPDEMGWHAGTGANGQGNINSVAIELIMENGKTENDKKVLRNCFILIEQHLEQYLPGSKDPNRYIKFHKDWSGKYCPRYILDTIGKDGFIKQLTDFMDGFEEKIIEEEEEMPKVYNTVEEVPEWARDKVKKYVDAGIIKGTSENSLGLTESDIKACIFAERMVIHFLTKAITDTNVHVDEL